MKNSRKLSKTEKNVILILFSVFIFAFAYALIDSRNVDPVLEQSADEIRKQKIEKQFSAWNGAHKNLQQIIKESAGDPESYEHIKTVYWDKSDHLVVETTYRIKNGFGALVLDSIKVKIDLDGEVYAVVE